jgi:heptosyltransferase-3
VRVGALGDILLLRRAVAALRRAQHRVRLLVPGRPGAALLGPGPAEASGLTPFDGPEVARLLAAEPPSESLAQVLRADAVVALTESDDLLSRLRPFAQRLLARGPRPGTGHHASAWLADPVRALGADPAPDPPPLTFTPEERRAARALAPPLPPGFLAVHPGSGSPSKNWPTDRFAAVARDLAGDRHWLLVLGPAEEKGATPLATLPGAVPVRCLPVRVLGALLAEAGLFVGNDSGVSHLAAAAGAPTLALFGPTDPATWSPVGPRVETLRSPTGRMEGLDAADVHAAIDRLRRC